MAVKEPHYAVCNLHVPHEGLGIVILIKIGEHQESLPRQHIVHKVQRSLCGYPLVYVALHGCHAVYRSGSVDVVIRFAFLTGLINEAAHQATLGPVHRIYRSHGLVFDVHARPAPDPMIQIGLIRYIKKPYGFLCE